MKQIHIALFLLLAQPARAADEFPIHVYSCPKADVAPALDGKLDDAVGQKAHLVSGFVVYESGQFANEKSGAVGAVDAAQWTRLDIAMQDWVKCLRKSISEARLKVLLDNI